MKIGITERGDASLDFTWYDKIKSNKVDGAVLITKNITPTFIGKVMDLYNNGFKKIIIHCTCTGWGESYLEPNVPNYKVQLKGLANLINCGFPKQNCVLRIDPIIPTDEGIKKTINVIDEAYNIGFLPNMRIRISIYDEYKHVKNRLTNLGITPFYGESFYAPKYMMRNVVEKLEQYDLIFETCAEIYLNGKNVIKTGCISQKDLEILNLNHTSDFVNPQNRNGCLCMSCKTELLDNKCQCPYKCIYCYWKNE